MRVATVPGRQVAGVVRLRPILSSVAEARALLSEVVARAEMVDGPGDDAAIVVSELVTNAVLHARTSLDVAVLVEHGSVHLEVTDASPHGVSPAFPAAAPMSIGDGWDDDDTDLDAVIEALPTTGRGMALVAALSRDWGVEDRGSDGKTVWADIGPATGPVPNAPSQVADPALRLVEGPTAEVHLVAVPVRLIVDSDRQLADSQRELQFVDLSEPAAGDLGDLAERAAALADGLRFLRLGDHPDVRHALACGYRLVDVHLVVPVDAVDALARLDAFLADLGAARRQRQLLALGPSGEVVDFRRWYHGELGRQLEGEPLQPSPFPVVPLDGVEAPVGPLGERESELLERLSEEIASAADRAAVAATVVAGVVAHIGAGFADLLLVDEGGTCLESAARAGDGELGGGIVDLSDDDPAGEVVRTGVPIALRTPEERLDRYPHLRVPEAVMANPTGLWVPLGPGAPAVGVVAVGFARSPAFTDADVAWLGQVGLAAAARLEAL